MQHQLNQAVCKCRSTTGADGRARTRSSRQLAHTLVVKPGARPGSSDGSVQRVHERDQREAARGDGVQDRLLSPVTFSVEQLENLKLKFDPLASRHSKS